MLTTFIRIPKIISMKKVIKRKKKKMKKEANRNKLKRMNKKMKTIMINKLVIRSILQGIIKTNKISHLIINNNSIIKKKINPINNN